MKSWSSRGTAVLLGVAIASGFALAASQPHYLVTNDDVPAPFATDVTFYTVAGDGRLTMKAKVPTGGIGIGGGYFAAWSVLSALIACLDLGPLGTMSR